MTMGLFDGLDKFGMKGDVGDLTGGDLFADKDKPKAPEPKVEVKEPEPEPEMTEEERLLALEKSFLIKKHIRCKCCEQTFATLSPKSGRVKRKEPDRDLRPRSENFDTLKYGVYHCPHCGYTSTARDFQNLGEREKKAVMEKICSQFTPEASAEKETLTYDEAIGLHKLALYNEVVKNGKASEKAYICLVLGWLYRGKAEELAKEDAAAHAEEIKECKKNEREGLEQAFDGFFKAFSSENAPFAGMDELTLQYLLAALGFELGKYDVATKSISNIITSKAASNRMKDKARELKDEIIASLRTKK
jgi:hypothetical protein